MLRQAEKMLQYSHLSDFRKSGRLISPHVFGQCGDSIAHNLLDLFFNFRDQDSPFSFCVQFKNNGFIPLGLMKIPDFWLFIFFHRHSLLTPNIPSALEQGDRCLPWCGLQSRSTAHSFQAQQSVEKGQHRRKCFARARTD